MTTKQQAPNGPAAELTQTEMATLRTEARKHYEKVSDYGGATEAAMLNMLVLHVIERLDQLIATLQQQKEVHP